MPKSEKMKKVNRYIIILLGVLVLLYFFGPKPPKPNLNKDLPSLSASIGNIDQFVKQKGTELPVKPDNESRIIWANDSLKNRTDYCLLYLHGFSASWYEGFPVHMEFARHFGMNAYLPRLASHGLETEEALIDMTPEQLWESAKEALMVARTLGRNTIIMGTSTGGTLALKLAADFPEYVDGLVLYSPNIRINNSTAFLVSKPWGLQLVRNVYDGKYRVTNDDFASAECKYWNCKYRLEAVVYLQQLVESTMKKETFNSVNVPVFLGYYYKDDKNQDEVVKVDAMLKMFRQLGTLPDEKKKVAFPEAGTHVIANEMFSSSVDEVLQETIKFSEEQFGLNSKK